MAQTESAPLPAETQITADPAIAERVRGARDFIQQLLKGIKQIGMYRHNDARFADFLQPALASLRAYHQAHQSLALRIDAQNFVVQGQNLFEEDSPLPYKFYREGIRQLIFRADITLEELVSFTLMATSEPERGADDLIAQLWSAELEHIEYVVVEGFKIDDQSSEEEVQVEVDQVVNYLYSRLRGASDDYLRFARVSTEDLEVSLQGVDQLRGAVVTGITATDDLKARLQRDIEEEENSRLFPKLVSAIFQVVEGGVEDPALLEDIFAQLLDALLIQEDFATINQIVLKLKAIEQRDGGTSAPSRLRQALTARMGEQERLTRVGGILQSGRAKSPQDVSRYLQALDPSAMLNLLTVAETLEIPENRMLLLDVLAHLAVGNPDPFVARLRSDRPQTVRDMVYVLEKSKHPDRLKMFGQILKNPNLALRLEAMAIIARGRTRENRRLIAEALTDSNAQVRIAAARLLPEFDRDKAFVDLVALVRDSTFEKKSDDERTGLYAALGSTGVPQALALFTELLHAKPSLLNRRKVMDDKLMAIHGLASVCSVPAYKLLQELVEDRSQPPDLLAIARKALYQTKKALFGEGSEARGG